MRVILGCGCVVGEEVLLIKLLFERKILGYGCCVGSERGIIKEVVI